LLVTERSALDALFDCPRATSTADADVAIVDTDGGGSVEAVRSLLRERPELPIAALVCCTHCVDADTLRELLAEGICGVLDLHGTPEITRRELEALADGTSVLHIRLGQSLLRELLASKPPLLGLQADVLALVAQGLRDREIGARLHLSPHTVKHRVEQLCRTVGARNRIELAAWAGRNGF
jgi:DNA-binding NarL/FixJ family response regulator